MFIQLLAEGVRRAGRSVFQINLAQREAAPPQEGDLRPFGRRRIGRRPLSLARLESFTYYGKMESSGRPNIFNYTDYRIFLKDHIAWERKLNPKASLRSLSARITPSLSSSSFLSGVLNGKKNIGPRLRVNFIKALDLKPREGMFFDLLVQFGQSNRLEEKGKLFAQLSRFRHSRAKRVYESQFRFFTQWHYAVVWNYFGIRQKVKGPSEIADAIQPRLTPAQVQEAINLLLELGLIKKLANGYAVTNNHLSTEPEFRGLEAIPYSEMFLDLAAGALHSIEPENRKFGTLVFSASRKTVDLIKEKLDAFQEDIEGLIDRDDQPEEIHTFCFQLFPNTVIRR